MAIGAKVKINDPGCSWHGREVEVVGFDPGVGMYRVEIQGGVGFMYQPPNNLTHVWADVVPTPTPKRKKLVEVVESGRRFYAMREM